MGNLYTLDLSFCTRVTAASIFHLLEIRHDCLSELRLKSCSKLEIARDPQGPPATTRGGGANNHNNHIAGGSAGRLIVNGIRRYHGACDHCLCVLDVRECGGQPSVTEPYLDNDPFVTGMKNLQFEQRVPGFFSRPARWSTVQSHLVDQFNVRDS
jgi:hypothetical protein